MKLLSKKEIKIVKRTVFVLKKYKDDPKAKPNVKNSLDYNIWLIINKKIPIQELGEY